MLLSLHNNATTTPAICRAVRGSREPAVVLAKPYGISPKPVRRWRDGDGVEDRGHTAHRLQVIQGQQQRRAQVPHPRSLPVVGRLAQPVHGVAPILSGIPVLRVDADIAGLPDAQGRLVHCAVRFPNRRRYRGRRHGIFVQGHQPPVSSDRCCGTPFKASRTRSRR